MNQVMIAFLANILGCVNQQEKVAEAIIVAGIAGLKEKIEGAVGGTLAVATDLKVSEKKAADLILKKLKGLGSKTDLMLKEDNSTDDMKAFSKAATTYIIGNKWNEVFDNAHEDGGDGNNEIDAPEMEAADWLNRVATKGAVIEHEETQEVVLLTKIELKGGKNKKSAAGGFYRDVTVTLNVPSIGLRRYRDNSSMLLIRISEKSDSLYKALYKIDNGTTLAKLQEDCKASAVENHVLDETVSAKFAEKVYQLASFQQTIAFGTTYPTTEPAAAQAAVSLKAKNSLFSVNPVTKVTTTQVYHTSSGVNYRGLQDHGDADAYEAAIANAEVLKQVRVKREEIAFQTNQTIAINKANAGLIAFKVSELFDVIGGEEGLSKEERIALLTGGNFVSIN
jgi:hypothetical protein